MDRVRLRRSALASLVCAAVLLVATVLLRPLPEEIVFVDVLEGTYEYVPGRVGSSAYSTLNGRVLLCGASIRGATSQCVLAGNGESIRVERVRVPSLLSHHLVAIRAQRGNQNVYQLSAEQLSANWTKRSIGDVIYFSLLLGFAVYGALTFLQELRRRK
jgi:hypothetical protein